MQAESEARDIADRAILAKRPADAAALIVAELDEDTSDSMTDYFAHDTIRRVAIGWRTGRREDFRQLRRAAGLFPETRHLGPDAPDNVEHRDNYSMGGGNYLKAGSSHWSGWRVVSERIGDDGTLPRCYGPVLEDGLLAGTPPDPFRTCSSTGFLARPADSPAGLDPGTSPGSSAAFRIQASTNKRGPFSLVVLADRVERDAFERLRDSAKRAGGWYSRAFGGQPGGFGFSDEPAARAWAEREFPNVGTPAQVPTCSPDSPPGLELGTRRNDGGAAALCTTGGPGYGLAPPIDPPEARTRLSKAERLEGLADNVAAEITRKRAPLTQNWTARRARIKDRQRRDADRLEQIERGLRAMAAALRENRLPVSLASSLTRAGVERLVARQDVTLATLVTDGLDDRTRAEDAARLETERVRKLEDSFRGADIPGFFPTPPAVAARMMELLELKPGMSVLEPSAGLGHLAELARTAGGDVVCVELNLRLAGVLEAKGLRVTGADFLSLGMELGTFDRVLMNPPFERCADLDHIRHALRYHLKPGGRLVAVVTPRAAGTLAVDFGATIEPLPEGSFSGRDAFRQTSVSAYLVMIERGTL